MEILQQFNILDIILTVILVVSVVVGLVRGAVREIFSIVGLGIAIFMAFKFSDMISKQFIIKFIESEQISYIFSFILIIICTILVIALVNLMISQLLRASGLSFIDRFLGMIFGVFRGALFCCIIILVAGFIPSLTEGKWWQESKLAPIFKEVTAVSLKYMPDNIAAYFNNSEEQNKLVDWTNQVRETAKQAGVDGIDSKMDEVQKKIQSDQTRDILESISDSKEEMKKQGIQLESTAPESTADENDSSE